MYDGIINIYKEKGYTSHDVVAKLRGILKQKKIGHTGTLDPDATGVLPVCLGKGTKLCDMLTDRDKEYHAVMLLGRATDTQDITGNVTEETDILEKRKELGDETIIAAIEGFVGDYDQLPPMYSAVRVNGKHLYELAREGVEVERKPRRVKISSIKNIVIRYPEISMDIECSKGTYIRTLCHDIGIRLGTFACMTALERTRSGSFTTDTAITLTEVENRVREGGLEKHILSVEEMFQGYERIRTEAELRKLLYNGNPLPIASIERNNREVILRDNGLYRVCDDSGSFIGIYRLTEGMLKPEKLFFI